MAEASGSVTTKSQCIKKVSKPLMEKKRRARINKCLNQLKSLLESVCSNNIRKRKLEKADILELTVKHLRYLQNTERGMPNVCDSEYQAGYTTCLANVSRYLLASDADRDSRSIMLTHLTSAPNHASVPDFSTTESNAALVLAPASRPLLPSHRISVKADAPYPNLKQNSDRNYCVVPKKTDICIMHRISLDAQVEATGSLKLKKSCQNLKVDECCSLIQNYWRPW